MQNHGIFSDFNENPMGNDLRYKYLKKGQGEMRNANTNLMGAGSRKMRHLDKIMD